MQFLHRMTSRNLCWSKLVFPTYDLTGDFECLTRKGKEATVCPAHSKCPFWHLGTAKIQVFTFIWYIEVLSKTKRDFFFGKLTESERQQTLKSPFRRNRSYTCFFFLPGFIHSMEVSIPREPQHTSGAYPRPPQTPKWKEFLHKLLVPGLGYVPGVCWKILRSMQIIQED